MKANLPKPLPVMKGRRLTKALELAEVSRDEALAVGEGVGGEAVQLKERLQRALHEKSAFEEGASREIASKVRGRAEHYKHREWGLHEAWEGGGSVETAVNEREKSRRGGEIARSFMLKLVAFVGVAQAC